MSILDFGLPVENTGAGMTKDRQPGFFSAQISEAKRFYFDLQPARSTPLAVVCGGCEHCTADFAIHRQSFPYWSVEFVAQGQGRLMLGGRPHALVPGTVFAYGPGVAQHIAADPQHPMVKYFVDFTGRQAATLLAHHGLRPGSVLQTSAPSVILAVFDDLIRSGVRITPFTARILTLQVELLLVRLAETRMPAGAAATQAFATYQRCRRLIEQKYLTLRTAEEVAAACHVQPAYLSRLFQRFDHHSPYRYLLRLKMDHAADRLVNSGLLVKQAADELGFANAYHFSRAFKKVHGLSPAKFLAAGRRGLTS